MRFLLVILGICIAHMTWSQGTTSSEIRGIITDAGGESLIGANVVAIHLPSGTTFGTATGLDGNYQISGMRVGGPYLITASYTGYNSVTLENIELRLGETLRRDFTLTAANIQLDAVMIVGAAGVTGQTAGTSTNVTTEQIEAMPTLNRDINDFLKMTPQSNSYSDGISLAGINNRYNAIYIDGAVNNDVYGISSSGTNGGQTGISPFSIDIIDQFQVVISPYDVSLGGFAGGGINAVTKSGTNKLYASAYYYMQNENLAGKTNGLLAEQLGDVERTKLFNFSKKTYGASIGGPITKDKLFFFGNIELQDDISPIPFDLEQYTAIEGREGAARLDQLRQFVRDTFGYDPGRYLNNDDELEGIKLFGKLDLNINEKNRFTLRHQYTKAERLNRNGGSGTQINFANNGEYFPSTTNSSSAELKSNLGQSASNDLILGYTTVKDDRAGIGPDFPFVIINDDANATIRFGSEEFSVANLLEQSVFTITDNFKLYKGKHTFTFGTHNEFNHFKNIFIGSNFGRYTFTNIDSFLNQANAFNYERTYSLLDDGLRDETNAAADFNAIQLGFYAQDQWTINPLFTLTGGLRIDIPIITTDPALDTVLLNSALPTMRGQYPIANNIVPGKSPDGQIMFSPRIGFEYAFNQSRDMILRGGLGIFTSRIPFVWPGAMFTNNGLTIGRVTGADLGGSIPFIPDVNNQYKHPSIFSRGQVDLFVKDFKYPQMFRTNLALDGTIGNGYQFSVEGLFTKTLNNVAYVNINSDTTLRGHMTGSGMDNRNIYFRRAIDSRYTNVYIGYNTSEGYTFNITGSLAKDFGPDFNALIAYNYGDAYALNEGTSSQNSSQWRGQVHINGRNNPVFGRSDFAAGHRVMASASYKLRWREGITTHFSMFYSGESGEAFSYVIGGTQAFSNITGQNINAELGSTNASRTLVYVPKDRNDINLVDYTVTTSGGTVTVPADDQWNNLNAMIESDPALSDFRGQYVEKNGAFAPFNHILDFAIRQDIGTKLGGDLHRIQLSFDIFNFANLLHKNWGAYYITPGSEFNNFALYQFDGYEPDGLTPKFSYRLGSATGKDAFAIDGTRSRWRMRLGIRYILN